MNITELIHHPERMDRDTLYELRSLLALYPYFQNARLLLLQNLYLLHDATFDEELRKAAIYITDRKMIFQMIEAGHYKLAPRREKPAERQPYSPSVTKGLTGGESLHDSRTISLIDDFLDSLPREDLPGASSMPRKPTPADATTDYVAYLLECEEEMAPVEEVSEAPQMKGQDLIDSFIKNDTGKIVLNEKPQLKPELPEETTTEEAPAEDVNTEAMARIYMKQGNYSRALQIIKQLSLENPKKNAYFADQIRFIEKVIINNKYKK
ncbi:MAG: tetratricopeptide repeat protein [Prevotella sp.]|nr:tetratricopeptide repeat protein [Prevotella sp.]